MRPKTRVEGRSFQPQYLEMIQRSCFGLEIIHNQADANEKMQCRGREKRLGCCLEVPQRRVHYPFIITMFLHYNKAFHCKFSLFHSFVLCTASSVANCQHNSLPTMKSQCPFRPICHCVSVSPPTHGLRIYYHGCIFRFFLYVLKWQCF